MTETATDFYQQKTDAELLFFVEHPDYYQPSLVDNARRELRRRGINLSGPPVPVEPAAPAEAARAGLPVGLLSLLAAVLLVVAMGTFYVLKHSGTQPGAGEPATPAGPPRLTEVATSAIPNYDGLVANCVAQQLKRVPGREKANAQHLRQFRELTKRFWAAETQTEYLTNQAHQGKANPMFIEQALVVRQTWTAWNHAAVYHFGFGPIMQAQFSNMNKVASSQQHILDQLPGLLPQRQFLKDKEIVAREAEVQDWMVQLRPASPVTGKPYRATVLRAQL